MELFKNSKSGRARWKMVLFYTALIIKQ
jgi:hypothetical protein